MAIEKEFDAIVLGLGAMGSAALYQLAKRGANVLGIDRYSPPHARGSSHGDTRITRLAIGEGAQYTPLVLRSHEIWRELEALTGRSLLTITGGLIISSRAPHAFSHVAAFFDNTVAAARKFGIRHDVLDAGQIRARFPQFKVREDEFAYYEYDAGFLRPEECVGAHLALAGQRGARIHRNERVVRYAEADGRVTVETDLGEYEARRLIVAAGPWLPGLLGPECSRWFTVTRQVQSWFDVKTPIEDFEPGRFPVFIWELQGQQQPIYGFPAIDGPRGGVKIATEKKAAETTPEEAEREIDGEETRTIYETFVAPHFPAVDGRCVKALSCLYTMTPDSHFVIDRHPRFPSVLIASPCSGHGFKHSAAIGEALAQLVLDGKSATDIGGFAIGRFG